MDMSSTYNTTKYLHFFMVDNFLCLVQLSIIVTCKKNIKKQELKLHWSHRK